MKRLFVLLLCLVTGCFASAQKITPADVPSEVMNVYKTKISDSLPATWEKSGTGYIAHFKKKNLDARVVITDKGEWDLTQWDIPSEYLPKTAKEYIIQKYSGYKIKNAMIEYKPGGEFYLIGIKKGKDQPVLRFSIKAEIIGPETPDNPGDKK
jgi:hypothetical protein